MRIFKPNTTLYRHECQYSECGKVFYNNLREQKYCCHRHASNAKKKPTKQKGRLRNYHQLPYGVAPLQVISAWGNSP